MYSCINELFERLVTEYFVVWGRLAVLYSDWALAPVYTVRRSRLVCDGAVFHILSFPHAPAHPGLRGDWKRNFWNTRGRPFLWYCHPSQNQETSQNLPKEEKKKTQTARESLPACFPSQGDLEKHLNVWEVIQTRPVDLHSLFGVRAQPLLRRHWGGSCLWVLISSPDLPTVIT